jgi:A/G-specific adenine glycosylase
MAARAARAGGGTAGEAPAALLLAWFDRHRRRLPWRAGPGATPDPYRVWLSEIMLQQTTVPTVAGHYERFLARFPSVKALAGAPLDDVLHAWQGLGYYARARNLHRAAGAIMARHGGRLPRTEAALRALPGIGDYTVAALRAIAFGRRANVVDSNVERVIARLFAVETPLPRAKAELKWLAATLVPRARPGDYAQALMDLGALVCTPRNPGCLGCPLAACCAARQRGIAADLPRRAAPRDKPLRHGVVFWLEREDGAVLLRRRPDHGLLGGMIELPSTPWGEAAPSLEEARQFAPVRTRWLPRPGTVAHGFTHFDLELRVVVGRAPAAGAPSGLWARPAEFHRHALPTLTKKVVRHVLGGAFPAAQATRRAASG